MSHRSDSLTVRAASALGRSERALLAIGGAALLAFVAACGGGGGGTEPDTNPPPASSSSFTSGAITGFGSVIVNGVRFDDGNAEVVDEDGEQHDHDDLQLGDQVEIEASSIDRNTGQGVATRILVASEMVGPVASVDVVGQTLVVLGQTVVTSAHTVFDEDLPGGLAGVQVGQVLEVHAQFDAAQGVYRATRIEVAGSPAAYKLRGLVTSLDTAAHTFQIGDATINYASATEVTSDLANGTRVRVLLQTTPVDGQWVAIRVRGGDQQHGNHDDAEIQGLITAWTSATEFSVNGLPVDARNASFPDGQAGVVLGARVEIEGAIVDGVLVATKVHLEDAGDGEHDGDEYELHGAITAFDPVAHTFVLRGVVVSYSEATDFHDMGVNDLAIGAKVEVKGDLSADGTRVDATRIESEN